MDCEGQFYKCWFWSQWHRIFSCLFFRTSAVSCHATFPVVVEKRLKSASNLSKCGHLWLLWLCFFEIAWLKIGLIWISRQYWAQLGHNGHLKCVTLDMYCSKIKYLFDLSYTWMESKFCLDFDSTKKFWF